MLQKRVWCKTRLYFGALVVSLLATLLTGLSVRPFLDQVCDYSTPRMALLTPANLTCQQGPQAVTTLSALERLLRSQKSPVSTMFHLTEPHRPNESFPRSTGRIHAGHNHPSNQPHTLILRNTQSRPFLNPCPCPDLPHWSPQNSPLSAISKKTAHPGTKILLLDFDELRYLLAIRVRWGLV